MPNISIVIPSRNRKKFIEQLLDDLDKQSQPIHEIIVIDQSDVPYQLNNCIYIYQKYTGPCKSRNIGIKNATGDILVFLDDDISIAPDFIDKITQPIRENLSPAVAGANCDASLNYKHQFAHEYLESPSANWVKILTANPNFPGKKYTFSLPGCCFAIRRDVLDTVGYFDEFFDPSGAGEDREMAVRLFKHGYDIYYNGDAAIQHFAAPEGGSRDIDSRSIMLDINLGYIVGKHFSKQLFDAYRTFITWEYRQKLVSTLKKGRGIRTRYQFYTRIKKEFNKIEEIIFG